MQTTPVTSPQDILTRLGTPDSHTGRFYSVSLRNLSGRTIAYFRVIRGIVYRTYPELTTYTPEEFATKIFNYHAMGLYRIYYVNNLRNLRDEILWSHK